MSTFGVWDPYWNGLDRFEHDDFAGIISRSFSTSAGSSPKSTQLLFKLHSPFRQQDDQLAAGFGLGL
jgi:hypothetical protein